MASKHREQKVIAAVACPDCGAPRGKRCRRANKGQHINPYAGRLFVCRGRLVAWQMVLIQAMMVRDGEVT